MNNEEIILGLDISTKCIGVCLYYFHPAKGSKILKITHFLPKVSNKISGIEKLFIKAKIFEDEFLSNIKDINITKVIIEEPLMKSNNVNTVDVLLKFNGIISNSIYKILGIVPDYISSYDARRYAFPELISIRRFNKNGEKLPYEKLINLIRKNDIVLFGDYPFDCDKKLILWNKISEQYPYIEWVYGKNGELKKENFDASDALVTCIGYTNKIKYGEIIEGRNCFVNLTNSDDKKIINYSVKIWGKEYNKKIIL